MIFYDKATRVDVWSYTLNGGKYMTTFNPFMPLLKCLASWYHLLCIFPILFSFFYCLYRRYRAKRILRSSLLPILFWTPRFIHYAPPSAMMQSNTTAADTKSSLDALETQQGLNNKDSKLPSSNITNILPRMERLNGPYGMYATVYGISTMIIHMAHPIPIQYILLEDKDSLGSSIKQPQQEDDQGGTTTTRIFINVTRSLTRLFNLTSMENFSQHTLLIPPRTSSSKQPAYNHFKNFSGEGVFTSDGTIWKEKRISVLHCLIRGMYDPVTKSDPTSITKLELEANRAAESFIFQTTCLRRRTKDRYQYEVSDKLWNIVPILQRSTIGLIYRYITHHNVDMYPAKDSNYESHDNNIIQREVFKKNLQEKDMQPYQLLDTYLQAVTDIRMIILAQSRSFWFLLPRWVYRWCSPMYKQEEKSMHPIRAFARMTCYHAQPESPLGMLRQRSSHNLRRLPHEVIGKDILDEAITLLFAGQDTSAATLSWAIHLLSLYPDTQRRLYHEICNVVEMECIRPSDNDEQIRQPIEKEDKSMVLFTKKMISRMTYLDAVIKETMRLYPAAPFIVRRLQEDVAVPMDPSDSSSLPAKDPSILLPKDSFACIWIYSVHRNSKLWNRPHDFLPERWIDSALREKDHGQRMSGSYIPFAAGPRNCLGQPLAHVILRIMLAKIIYNCEMIDPRVTGKEVEKIMEPKDISDVEPTDRCCRFRQDMQAGFTILPLGGVHVQINPRQSSRVVDSRSE